MKTAIVGPKIFDGEEFHKASALLVDGESIGGICSCNSIPEGYLIDELSGGIIAPGFIDCQVNGGGGVLFNNDISSRAIDEIVKGHLLGGTTSLLPTLISDTSEARAIAVGATKESIAGGNKSVLGLHLEGPYFSKEKRGTHKQDHLINLHEDDLEWLISIEDLRLLLTLAPECTGEGQISQLVESGIIISAGHTNTTSARVNEAIDEGLRGFTHLFNAMSPATGREPGVVGRALLSDSTWCGIIADGHHVHEDMIRLAFNAKPQGKLFLVTDAMSTVGSSESSFELYGKTIQENNGRLINSEGRLAGSAISMIQAVEFANQVVQLELSDCLRMASKYPAEFLNVDDRLGSLKVGYRSDLVHFDSEFKVLQSWVAGQKML